MAASAVVGRMRTQDKISKTAKIANISMYDTSKQQRETLDVSGMSAEMHEDQATLKKHSRVMTSTLTCLKLPDRVDQGLEATSLRLLFGCPG